MDRSTPNIVLDLTGHHVLHILQVCVTKVFESAAELLDAGVDEGQCRVEAGKCAEECAFFEECRISDEEVCEKRGRPQTDAIAAADRVRRFYSIWWRISCPNFHSSELHGVGGGSVRTHPAQPAGHWRNSNGDTSTCACVRPNVGSKTSLVRVIANFDRRCLVQPGILLYSGKPRRKSPARTKC